MPSRLLLMVCCLALLPVPACGGSRVPASASAGGEAAPETEAPVVRNLILMIGDGMGPQQVGLLEAYAHLAPNSIYEGRPTAMSRLANAGRMGMSRTDPGDGLVVDSACSATMLAAGVHAPSEGIGVDTDGYPLDTILTAAARSGRATGLVTDSRLTHATPAGFAAHVAHRNMEAEIAEHYLAWEVDVLLSGGLQYFLPASINDDPEAGLALTGGVFQATSRRADERDLIAEAQEAGYSVVYERGAMQAHSAGRLLGLFADRSMVDAIRDRHERDDPERTYPTLREMTEVSLAVLDQQPEGFFLMVEGGQIDWAAHDNDAGRLLHEMIRFDEAIEAVLEWAEGRDDTVVVVTADHETGGFGFSYSGFDIPGPQERPGPAFVDQPYHPAFNFGPLDVLDGLYAQQTTFRAILSAVQAAAPEDRVDVLLEQVNTYTSFPITRTQAERILETVPNRLRVEGHYYLSGEEMPRVEAYDAYYPYFMDGHMTLLARAQADRTHAVWNTGTHTHTPVPVLAWGPAPAIEAFGGMMHHVDLGQRFFDVLGLTPVRLPESAPFHRRGEDSEGLETHEDAARAVGSTGAAGSTGGEGALHEHRQCGR